MAATAAKSKKKTGTRKTSLRPLDNRVIVRRDVPVEMSPGGIVLPDRAKQDQQYGIVIAVGPGKLLADGSRAEMSVKQGDRVLFGRFAEQEVQLEGASKDDITILLREEDIYAVVEG